MPRKPKPYAKDGYYRTSVGGVQHRILCRVEEGMRRAEVALARLLVQLDDIKRNGGVPTDLQVGPTPVAGLAPAAKPTYPSVADALDDFMAFKKSETAGPTYDFYSEKLWPFRERFGDRAVNRVTYQDGLAYKTWLRYEKTWRKGKNGPLRKGLGNTTVNMHLKAARTFLDWCCKPSRRHTYGVTFNEWEEIGRLTEKPRERIITDEEFAHLLAHCEDGNTRGAAEEMRTQLVALRHTTMRPQELRELKWDYIHWDKHRIVFPAEVIKTRNRREVSMIDVVEEALEKWRRRLERFGLRPHGRFVFPSHAHRDGVRVVCVAEPKEEPEDHSARGVHVVCAQEPKVDEAPVRVAAVCEEQPNEDPVPVRLMFAHEAGRQWVLSGAGRRPIARLVRRWGAAIETADWRRFIPSAFGLAADLYFDMYPSRRGDKEAATKFWNRVWRPHPDDHFVYDFVEGAVEAADELSTAEV